MINSIGLCDVFVCTGSGELPGTKIRISAEYLQGGEGGEAAAPARTHKKIDPSSQTGLFYYKLLF